ncbi:protein mushroom body miniature [Eurosta solidaginis]|uniref:protein mushroom body miniature n=1 Tax=Eurosta solidaginis TaxID=178769 RepID=UPI0035306C4D
MPRKRNRPDDDQHHQFGGSGSLGNVSGGNRRRFREDRNRNSSSGPANKDTQDRSYDRFQKFRDPHCFDQRNNNDENWRRYDRRPSYGAGGGNSNQFNRTRRDNYDQSQNGQSARRTQGDQHQFDINNHPQEQHQQRVDIMNQPRQHQRFDIKNQSQEQQQHRFEIINQPQPTELSSAAKPKTPAAPPATENSAGDMQIKKENDAYQLNQHQLINIKQEKSVKDPSKEIIKPPSSSSSSEDKKINKINQPALKTKIIKAEPSTKEVSKKIISPSKSSSSSSSEEAESSLDAPGTSTSPAKTSIANETKIPNKPEKKKSSEDLICLGKLEKKFVIEDDASEEGDVSQQVDEGDKKNICLICDKKAHTAFECQMICKNCSMPYHNLKSCPKPANLSIVMQTFMEFCMGQMNQFQPEQKYTIPSYISTNEKIVPIVKETSVAENKKGKKANVKSKEAPKKLKKRKQRTRSASSSDEDDDEEIKKDKTEEETSTESELEKRKKMIVKPKEPSKKLVKHKHKRTANSSDEKEVDEVKEDGAEEEPSTESESESRKKPNVKSKEPTKKLVKRKRKRTVNCSDEADDDDMVLKKDKKEEERSSETESESDSSAKEAVRKSKKRRKKAPSAIEATEFSNTYIPPFPTFPSFGAAAAAYNPLLLSQLMHAGNFGTPKKWKSK